MSLEIKSIVVVLNDNLIDFLNYLEDNTEYKWNSGSKPKDFTPRGRNILFLKTSTKIIQATVRNLEQFKIDILDGVNTNEYVIISTVKELDFILNGNIRIEYNKPKELVYEKNNDIFSANEICIKIENSEELSELSDYLKEVNLSERDINHYIDNVGNIYPFYVFVKLEFINVSHLSSESDLKYDVENGGIPKSHLFDGSYEHVFNYNTDKIKVNQILKNKSLTKIIDYNKPKELVYESNNDNNTATEICIKIYNEGQLNELNNFLKEVDLHDRDITNFLGHVDEFPFFVFTSFTFPETGYITKDISEEYNLENRNFSEIDWLDGTYNRVFDYNKDKIEIFNILKNGKLPMMIDYNKPKQLVYESNNDGSTATEICIKVKNLEQLNELNDFLKEVELSDRDLNTIYRVEDDLPLFIFVCLIKPKIGWIFNDQSIQYGLENIGVFPTLDWLDDVYEHIFEYDTEKINVKQILRDRKITRTIDYNKPKQLVYESVSKIEKIVCDTTDKVECQKMVDYLIKNGYVWEDEWGDGSSSNIYANKILIFNLDDKTIFGVDNDNEYWDLKKTFKFYDADVCKIVNSLNELINILHIDYNKPNNLVYEMYNEIDNSSKISVKVSNKEELNELNDFLIKFDLSDDHDGDINRFSDMSDGFPFLVFIYLKGKSTSFITKQQLIEFDVENVDFSTLSWLNGVYNHVFDYGREKPIIHDILKDKKIIRTIDYNKPRQLVYENNLNEMKSDEDVNEIGVRITNMEELTKLSDLWISLGYTDDVIGLSEDQRREDQPAGNLSPGRCFGSY